MTSNQYRDLRNNLQLQACYCNIYSKEYKNLLKRIKVCNDKAYK